MVLAQDLGAIKENLERSALRLDKVYQSLLAFIRIADKTNSANKATPQFSQDTVSERLRRWTRNPLGSARRGSNPLGVVLQSILDCALFRNLNFQLNRVWILITIRRNKH